MSDRALTAMLPVHAILVEVPENPLHLCDRLLGKIARLWTVYLYDSNEVTYLCESRPSYYLQPLYINFELIDGLDDDYRESVEEELRGGDLAGTYMHCATVDRAIKGGSWKSHDGGEWPVDEDDRQGAFDDAYEYFGGNCCL